MDIEGYPSLVKINLCEHEVSCQHKPLGRMPATLTDAESRRPSVDARYCLNGCNQSMQIEATILDTAMVGVSEQVVHPISVHLTINEISPKNTLLGARAAFQQRRHIVSFEAVVVV